MVLTLFYVSYTYVRSNKHLGVCYFYLCSNIFVVVMESQKYFITKLNCFNHRL